MIRIGYVAGRFRHYSGGLPREPKNYDKKMMDWELKNEEHWIAVLARNGMMWIAPLANSVAMEFGANSPGLSGDEYVARDLAVLERLRPNFDVILMRPGWDDDPESVGARMEYEFAKKRDLIVVYGRHGENRVEQYLKSLNEGA